MGKMEIPKHIPVEVDVFIQTLSQLLGGDGLRQVTVVSDKCPPETADLYCSITRVPFLFICLEGFVEAAIYQNSRTVLKRLQAGEALLFGPDTWVNVTYHESPLSLRITYDTDHTLFGLHSEYRSGSTEYPYKELEIHMCPKTAGVFATSLLNHVINIPATEFEDAEKVHTINLLLAESVRLLWGNRELQDSKSRQTWESICSYVCAHYREAISRSSTARMFGITPDHISHLFKKYHSMTFNQFVESLRLEDAKAMLRSSGLNISEISYLCGFSTPNYFIRVFKKTMGITASEYKSRFGSFS